VLRFRPAAENDLPTRRQDDMDGSLTNRRIQTDLRDFIAAVEEGGELKTVAGAHWDKEIGAVTEVLYREKVDRSPLLVFD
jgi:hypothetical protein